MLHITMFAAHEGQLGGSKFLYLTMFGGTELTRPTLARQILVTRQQNPSDPVHRRRPFVLTIFGGTSIKSPTLAAEFLDLRELIGSGVLRPGDWDRGLAEISRPEDAVASLTLFGGFEQNALPSEEQEIESLAIQCHLGNIDDGSRQMLLAGIGQRDAERQAVLRRAVYAAA